MRKIKEIKLKEHEINQPIDIIIELSNFDIAIT